jgi:hypothetical protein
LISSGYRRPGGTVMAQTSCTAVSNRKHATTGPDVRTNETSLIRILGESRTRKPRRRDGPQPFKDRGQRRAERSLPRPGRRPAAWDGTGSTVLASIALRSPAFEHRRLVRMLSLTVCNATNPFQTPHRPGKFFQGSMVSPRSSSSAKGQVRT